MEDLDIPFPEGMTYAQIAIHFLSAIPATYDLPLVAARLLFKNTVTDSEGFRQALDLLRQAETNHCYNGFRYTKHHDYTDVEWDYLAVKGDSVPTRIILEFAQTTRKWKIRIIGPNISVNQQCARKAKKNRLIDTWKLWEYHAKS